MGTQSFLFRKEQAMELHLHLNLSIQIYVVKIMSALLQAYIFSSSLLIMVLGALSYFFLKNRTQLFSILEGGYLVKGRVLVMWQRVMGLRCGNSLLQKCRVIQCTIDPVVHPFPELCAQQEFSAPGCPQLFFIIQVFLKFILSLMFLSRKLVYSDKMHDKNILHLYHSVFTRYLTLHFVHIQFFQNGNSSVQVQHKDC